MDIVTKRKIMNNMVELGMIKKSWNDKENNFNYSLTEYGKNVDKRFEDEKNAKIQRDLFGILG